MSLTEEDMARLVDAAGYHREPLRVTPGFYDELRRFEPAEPPSGCPLTAPIIPVGREVVVVSDGSENVRMVGGSWAFMPTQEAKK